MHVYIRIQIGICGYESENFNNGILTKTTYANKMTDQKVNIIQPKTKLRVVLENAIPIKHPLHLRCVPPACWHLFAGVIEKTQALHDATHQGYSGFACESAERHHSIFLIIK